jgi:hypothetical protein
VKILVILAAVCFALISGCSKGPVSGSPSASSTSVAPAAIASFPATLEGKLTIEVSNDWGYFGDIAASGAEHPVAIPADIFEASGVANTGGMVRLTVDSKQDAGSSYQYIVSSLTKL